MKQISVTELSAYLSTHSGNVAEPSNWQLLDVREPWEFDVARIDGAIHIPMQQIVQRYSELDPDKLTFCLCHHGMRSMQVGMFLERQGFKDVVNIQGGIDAWSAQVDASVPIY